MDKINHILQCKELLKEASSRINMFITLEEIEEGKNNYIEIQLKDKNGYLIYRSYEVSNMLGFINGIEYAISQYNK